LGAWPTVLTRFEADGLALALSSSAAEPMGGVLFVVCGCLRVTTL
jgi:hypothetical protein